MLVKNWFNVAVISYGQHDRSVATAPPIDHPPTSQSAPLDGGLVAFALNARPYSVDSYSSLKILSQVYTEYKSQKK